MKLRSQAFQGTKPAARAVGIPGLQAGEDVKLWGDSGCWRGPYGNWVGLTDLLRYARQSVAQHA